MKPSFQIEPFSEFSNVTNDGDDVNVNGKMKGTCIVVLLGDQRGVDIGVILKTLKFTKFKNM